MQHLTLQEVLLLHARLVQRTGGAPSVRDMGPLDAALARPRATFDDADLCADVWLNGAALLHALCQNYPFVDGNKRVALAAAGIFLQLNGRSLVATNDQALQLMRGVATGRADIEAIASWLERHTTGFDVAG
ncbi:MAG: type II toxin-antitoxin system death-on-curing family toxin [Anaerolineae bacterium]